MPDALETADKWIDRLWKVGTPVVGGVLIWLNSRYVTREEFRELAKDVQQTQAKLMVLDAVGADDRQDVLLADHEFRIRALEKPKP